MVFETFNNPAPANLEPRFQESLNAFREGLYRELEAQREQANRTDIRVSLQERLESRNGKYRGAFLADRAGEQLVVGATGQLVCAEQKETDVRVVLVDDREVVLASDSEFKDVDYRLSLSPWFLFERLQEQLETLQSQATPGQVETALQALGLESPPVIEEGVFSSAELNAGQERAVAMCLKYGNARVWGPPGTGKTTTLAVLVAEYVKRGERVLLASNTHAALDQVLNGLLRRPELEDAVREGKILRLGRTASEHRQCHVGEVTRRLHAQLKSRWECAETRLTYVRERVKRIETPLKNLQIATGPSEQLSLFESPEPRGLPRDWLEETFGHKRAEQWSRLPASEQCELLENHVRRLSQLRSGYGNRIADCREALEERHQQTVSRAVVILSTLANLTTSRWMQEQSFDNVVVEEAGMAILPSFFLACLRATKRTVAVGDPRQLPSILTSRDPFVKHSLGRSVFELGEAPKTMLTTQYRMHPEIGAMVGHLAYDGELSSARGAEEFEEWTRRDPLEGGALAGFDLHGTSVCQRLPGQSSRFNMESAGVCLRLAQRAVDAGFEEVAIICPYRQQVRTLRKMIPEALVPQVECDTVHRYQGKERAVVIVDLVDGESFGPGNLLKDDRGAAAQLLNVALSRARYKLFLVGELNFLCRRIPHSFVGRAITYLARNKKLFKVKPK